jgi:hypothetical protein
MAAGATNVATVSDSSVENPLRVKRAKQIKPVNMSPSLREQEADDMLHGENVAPNALLPSGANVHHTAAPWPRAFIAI